MTLAATLLSAAPALLGPPPAEAARAPLATVKVKQPKAVTSAARFVILNGTARGKYAKTLVVQRKVNTKWRKVATVRASRSWTVTVRLPSAPSTYRIQARTSRGAVNSNRVTVRLKTANNTPVALPLDQYDAQRARILNDTNAYRLRYGLAPLKPMTALDKIATEWSKKQAAARRMSHNPGYWLSYPPGYKAAAENVAFGFHHTQIVAKWILSAPHRKNLLGDYTHVGIGYALDRHGLPYYTQDFARY